MASQKILIVDDSKVIRMQVKDMLPVGGFEILEAKDGLEGLDLIQQEQPNLVLLDFFMPRMNGWEVIQKIQTQPKFSAIPVVMMSGRKEDVEQAVPELFDYFEFISKPFEKNVLMGAIRSAMTKAKHRQQMPARQVAPISQATPKPPAVETQIATSGAIASSPATTPAATPATDELQTLKVTVQQLQAQNAKLQTEVDGLKKQMNQVLTFIRQKLK